MSRIAKKRENGIRRVLPLTSFLLQIIKNNETSLRQASPLWTTKLILWVLKLLAFKFFLCSYLINFRCGQEERNGGSWDLVHPMIMLVNLIIVIHWGPCSRGSMCFYFCCLLSPSVYLGFLIKFFEVVAHYMVKSI